LQTTALVHEVFIRLRGTETIDWKNRGHFFAVAAQQMRRVLIDHARSAQAEKRWGGLKRVPLTGIQLAEQQRSEDLIALDEALQRLEKLHERAAKVVELRYFGGLSEDEASEALNISRATLKRDWEFARTWLVSQLNTS